MPSVQFETRVAGSYVTLCRIGAHSVIRVRSQYASYRSPIGACSISSDAVVWHGSHRSSDGH